MQHRLVILFLLTAATLLGNQRFNASCQQGGKTVVTGGVSGAPKVQGSYPQCQVTVYLAGTLSLATIYSDNSGTAKANPFTAAVDGSYFLYAANGRYDITMASGGLPAPVTLGDVLFADPFAAGGPVLSFNTRTGNVVFAYTDIASRQGNGSVVQMAGSVSGGAGTSICLDAGGNITTSGCSPGGVTSFNGRTGAVVPVTNDYTYSQIGGATQGNTTKPQMAGTNSGTAGATLCDDASGNATTSGCASGFPSGTQLQYLRLQPNTGNNTTNQFATLPDRDSASYSFPAITPTGSPSISVGSNTVTIPLAPLGFNAVAAATVFSSTSGNSAISFRISGGTGTAEAVPITGGTCTPQATACTVTFTAANTHSGAYTFTSSSDGIQEAVMDAITAHGGLIRIKAGTHLIYAPITISFATGAGGFNAAVSLKGDGMFSTILQQQANNKGILDENNTGGRSVIEDIGFTAISQGVSGSYGIRLGKSGEADFTRINNIYCEPLYDCILSVSGQQYSVTNSVFYNFSNTAITVADVAGPDDDGPWIRGNVMFNYALGSPADACVHYTSSGVLSFIDNKCVGSDFNQLNYGIYLDNSVSTGMLVTGNEFETIMKAGIELRGSFNLVTITGNFFAQATGIPNSYGIQMLDTAGAGVFQGTISGNVFQGAGRTYGYYGIAITGAAYNWAIGTNTFNHCQFGVYADTSGSITVAEQNVLDTETPIFASLGNTIFNFSAPVTFAQLPIAANGSALYCSNCNNTCTAGASTGKTCLRENGAWVASGTQWLTAVGGIWYPNLVGVGTSAPQGGVHSKYTGSPGWSTSNLGPSFVVDGNHLNAIAFLDSTSANPFGLAHTGSSLGVYAMPPLNDSTTAAVPLFAIDRASGNVLSYGSYESKANGYIYPDATRRATAPAKIAELTDYNFPAITPTNSGGTNNPAISVGANTIYIPLAPIGWSGANPTYTVYISGGAGTAEVVAVTGTCTPGALHCTMAFTAAHTHTGAYTVKPATGGLQECIYANPGGTCHASAGTYNVYGPVHSSNIAKIVGDSMENTIFMAQGDGIGILDIDFDGWVVEDVSLESTTLQTTSGYAARMGNVNEIFFARFNRVRCQKMYNCLVAIRISQWWVTNSRFYNFYNDAIIADADGGTSDGVGPQIEGNIFFNYSLGGHTANSCLHILSTGVIVFANNFCAGNSDGPIYLNYGVLLASNASTGLMITGNDFQSFGIAPMDLSGTWDSVTITGNVIDQPGYLDVAGNYGIRIQNGGGTGVKQGSFTGNQIQGGGTANFIAVDLEGGTANWTMTGNTIKSAAKGYYINCSGTVTVGPSNMSSVTLPIDSPPNSAIMNFVAPVTFAQLNNAANGSAMFCSNCNATCTAGASTGRTCFRENGAWTH